VETLVPLRSPSKQDDEAQIETGEGDGNCLFRAISFGLTGTEENHEHFRKIAAEEIPPVMRNSNVRKTRVMWGYLERGEGSQR
jgi:hypothetical protein